MSAPAHRYRHPQEPLWVALLLLCHVAVGIYYSVAIPIWEAHDEVGHYAKVRYIATEGHLPPPGSMTAPAMDETHQPPLYYLLAAVPVSALRLSGPLVYRPNPYAAYPDAQGGYNVAIHDAAAEAWPYQGDVLGVHVARWVSVSLGGLVVLLVYLSGRVLWPHRLALRWVAPLLVATWPQFRFSTAVVNNDIAVTLAAAVTLYGSVLLMCGSKLIPSVLVFGLGMGMLGVAKTNGLPLMAIGLLGLAVAAKQHGERRSVPALVGALALVATLAGWWYLRNLGATGDPLTGPWSGFDGLITGEDARSVAWGGMAAWGSWRHALRTFWAGFGQNNVAYPEWVYWAASVLVVSPLLGLFHWIRQRPPRVERAAVAFAGLIAIVAIVTPQALWALRGWSHVQGRYLLPGLPALGLVLGLGWVRLADGLRARYLPFVPLGAMAALVILTPMWVIEPAYAFPRTLSSDQLAAYEPTRFRFGVSVELVGSRILTPAVGAGDTFRAELVWRALKPTWTPLVLSAKVRDDAGRLLAEVTRFPGNGALATDIWEPGLYVDTLAMRLPDDLGAQPHQAIWLEVSLYPRWNADTPLAVFHENWERIGRSLRLGPAKLRGINDELGRLSATTYRFGEELVLSGIAVVFDGDTLAVDTAWRALADLDVDLHISLQLRDAANNVVAQHDGPLAEGRLPTSLWEAGDQLVDRRWVRVPETAKDDLMVYLCVYELISLRRWEVRQGDAAMGSELLLGTVRTEPEGFEPLWCLYLARRSLPVSGSQASRRSVLISSGRMGDMAVMLSEPS